MKHYKVDLLYNEVFVFKSFKNTTNIDFTVNLWFPCLDGLIQTRASTNQSTRYIHVIL